MRRLWVAIDRNGHVIPAMIYPIVLPKDLLETALSFLYLFIRPLVLISLLSLGPCFSMYRGKRCAAARDDAAGYTLDTAPIHMPRCVSKKWEPHLLSRSRLPFETRQTHRESVINFVGSRMARIGIDIEDHGETTISS